MKLISMVLLIVSSLVRLICCKEKKRMKVRASSSCFLRFHWFVHDAVETLHHLLQDLVGAAAGVDVVEVA